VSNDYGHQRIGPIRDSSRLDVEQRSDGQGTQEIEEIERSHDVRLRQVQEQVGSISKEATELIALLTAEHLAVDEIRPLIDESVHRQTITSAEIDVAERTMTEGGEAGPELSAALNALATAVSLTAGGIAVAALGNPVALAVTAPLTLGLAGIIGFDVVRKIFSRIRQRLLERN
jgi:hypothetical protein